VTAAIVTNPAMHINKPYILSGQHVAGFYNVAAMLSTTLHREVKNSNPNAYAFYRRKMARLLLPL
jgi:uncharacterized protein YbjT (DUF2867 family)